MFRGGSRNGRNRGNGYGYYGYRYYRRGGRGIGGLALVLAFLVLFLLYAVVVGVETTADVFGVLLGGGAIYDEEILQEYTEEQYAAEFADLQSSEDNVLIVVLVEPDCKEYYYYVRVGSHVAPELAQLYTGEDAYFDGAIYDLVERGSYEKTMSAHLSDLISRMDNQIWNVNDGRLFTCEEEHDWNSRLINRSNLELREKAVNRSVKGADLPTVLIVEDMRDVFGYHIPWSDLLITAGMLLAVAGVVVLAVLLSRRAANRKEKPPAGGRRQEGTDYVERLDDEHWEDRY